jgi:hypothetical protein
METKFFLGNNGAFPLDYKATHPKALVFPSSGRYRYDSLLSSELVYCFWR